MNKKLKIFIENISTLRSLGVKDFVIVDANENFANVVLLRASANPLKIFTISKPPNYKILSQRECKTTEDNIFELNREIRILSEKHKLKNAVLLLLINKYKYFNISLQKEDSDADEEISIGDLIRKQLPSNLNNSEFILHFEKISEDETLNSYLVTITRKQDIEKYSNVIYNDAFQLKFALPSIFTIANQKPVKDKVHTLIDIQRERLIHYQSVNEIKITEDEYFIDPEMGFEQSVIERIGEIITGISSTREEGSEQQ
ncbi:MAG: hypothetical protein Q8M94_20590, partial [Ignavibacteria bacterium]|nr:hypothetical protein [Ignavibacteria bacterium]